MKLLARGHSYWFESASEENLVILLMAAKAQNVADARLDVTNRKFAVMGAGGGRVVGREVLGQALRRLEEHRL